MRSESSAPEAGRRIRGRNAQQHCIDVPQNLGQVRQGDFVGNSKALRLDIRSRA